MLQSLDIRDMLLIQRLDLAFGPGLNVLTGETGAGKSIIVGALTVLLGDRASADMVRTGAERATVEGVFDVAARKDVLDALDERGLEHEDGTLVLKREIAPGRARAWINGTPVTASVLAAIGRLLVTVHGQHEAQTLLDTASQRRWLDATRLIERADDPAGALPYGAQRRLEIARAMCTEPSLLCLDEPAAGLNPRESDELARLLLDIRAGGTSILLIEHDMGVVMRISDRVVVLDHGKLIAADAPAAVRADPRVIAAYLGVDDPAETAA